MKAGILLAMSVLCSSVSADIGEQATLGHDGNIWSVAFAPDGKTLASSGWMLDFEMHGVIWDIAKLERRPIRCNPTEPISFDDILSTDFSPDGRTLAVAIKSNVKLVDFASGIEKVTFGGIDTVLCVAFAPDGKTLAACGNDKTVHLWDIATLQEKATLVGHERHVWSVVFSPDSKWLASGSYDKTVRIWDMDTRREITVLRGHEKWVNRVAFSPDGKTLASCSGDGTIKLWDITEMRERTTLRVHEGSGDNDWQCLAFAPDNRTLVSGDHRGVLKLWDTRTAQELESRQAHGDQIYCVAFSPDGRIFASGSQDRTVKLWRVSPTK